MNRDELARIIGDLVIQTLEQQAQIASLNKQLAEAAPPAEAETVEQEPQE